MTNLTTKTQPGKLADFSTILFAWLLVGTLDIFSAFLYSYLKRGNGPGTVLQYIAGVVWGKNAFSNTLQANLAGLAVHFTIALGWTILFYLLYPNLKWMRRNFLVTGICYGLAIWAIMNLVILPLWNNQAYIFKAEPALINAGILVLAIGLPLSFIARKKVPAD